MKVFKKWYLYVVLITVLLAVKDENYLIDIAPAISNVSTTQKVVALTFDDGPLNTSTPVILGVLQEKKVKATFFVVGERVKRFPSLVQQEVNEEHEIGNHTYNHPWLTGLNDRLIIEELEKTENEISKVVPTPTLFRPPGGKYNDNTIKLARSRGYNTILWSIDTEDWRSPPVGQIVNTVLNNVKPGSIILLHDGKYPSPTAESLEYIIDNLRARGYEFVTVSELLQYYEEGR
ncbi:Peptidoglycan-N-acetylglucosamine deacetylase [Sporomusa silvacetica DSM 10669]|uniref:Peptidoglycan-N-acetylglucosamine deacetylase n=1 Tax=Sporomusa silvacetica DSM 10669 TaxID=1123289 RepID=A0ABZ3INI1_9FIRM|nr:polysaccharide deacetylase family protein [Sporomusa silvacetica]OZC14762.1 peptidoglycan-N-acetylmuramic acid deacetylase PdaC [Sporomusa silvacetica DSM 10669]